MVVLHNFNFIFDILNSFNYYTGYIILLYNKYKIVEYYYSLYVNLYPFYRVLKKILLFIYFNLLKLYIIFINDSIFFNMSNFLWISFFKLKKLIKYNFKYYNRRNFKLRKKYKNYYRWGLIGYLKPFVVLALILLLVLMWRNRVSFYRVELVLYVVLFYAFVLNLCYIVVPLFYYKFIGVFFVMFLVFVAFALKVLN
jgi:hypothetical protein